VSGGIDDNRHALGEVYCLYLTQWLLMGNGRLTIDAGFVEFSYRSRRRLVHRAPDITVLHARLPVFLVPSAIELVGDDGYALYVWPAFRFREVRNTLEQAGFTLTTSSAWLAPIRRRAA
jgi:hypothetical protein